MFKSLFALFAFLSHSLGVLVILHLGNQFRVLSSDEELLDALGQFRGSLVQFHLFKVLLVFLLVLLVLRLGVRFDLFLNLLVFQSLGFHFGLSFGHFLHIGITEGILGQSLRGSSSSSDFASRNVFLFLFECSFGFINSSIGDVLLLL